MTIAWKYKTKPHSWKLQTEKKNLIKNTAPINLLFLFIQFVEEKVGGEPLQLASIKAFFFIINISI
jgi:hypothetical protein